VLQVFSEQKSSFQNVCLFGRHPAFDCEKCAAGFFLADKTHFVRHEAFRIINNSFYKAISNFSISGWDEY